MNLQSEMPEELHLICERWSKTMEKLSGYGAQVDYVQKELPGLLTNKALFKFILKNIMGGAAYPDTGQATMFDNELLLYLDSKRLFSIRLYLWGPGEYTPIHDHSSWGVLGTVSGDFEVIKFIRQDDGKQEEYVRLMESEKLNLLPGQTDVTLPLNNGIHKTGNPTDITTANIHLYGNPVRRSYINRFDLETGRVDRIYAPKARKRILASEALRGL